MQPNHSSTHNSISEESRPYTTASSVTDRPHTRISSVAPRLLRSGLTIQNSSKRAARRQTLQRAQRARRTGVIGQRAQKAQPQQHGMQADNGKYDGAQKYRASTPAAK